MVARASFVERGGLRKFDRAGLIGPAVGSGKNGVEEMFVQNETVSLCLLLNRRAKTMRVNSGGPNYLPASTPGPDGYPKNEAIVPFFKACIESFKEMADYGAEKGVKVTLENHWGLTCNPVHMRIILDAVNHPFCEASPDYANWEHEYMLFSGLKALAPYTSSNVHAKYWDRWGDANDVQRSVQIMMAGGFKGTFALEYEAGPLNGVEGATYLYREVLAALTKAETL